MFATTLRSARLLRSGASACQRRGLFYELRADRVLPAKLPQYIEEHGKQAAEQKALYPGWLGHWKVEMGGEVNVFYHLYSWDDYDQRDATSAATTDRGIVLQTPKLRDTLESTSSVALVEASSCLHACGLPGAGLWNPRPKGGPPGAQMCG